jgi:hypothetical protein
MTDDAERVMRAIVAILDSIRIPYMVVGSFAATFHGEPRSTRDLGLVIDPSGPQLDELLSALAPDDYYVDPEVAREALRRRSMFNVIVMATAWKVDMVIRKNRPFSIEEMERRQVVRILGVDVPAATAEDTIVAKLEWAKQGGSDRQIEDVAGILRAQGDAIDLGLVERWVDELGLGEQWQRAITARGTSTAG